MKNFNKFDTTQCKQVEELFIKQQVEELTAQETRKLIHHLSTCEHCKNYQSQLIGLHQTIDINSSHSLKPDPAIRKRIIQQMKISHTKRVTIIQLMWQKMVDMLHYRIPVYQGVIGMAVSLLILLAINYFSISLKPHPIASPQIQAMEEVAATQLNVVNSLEIIKGQKFGKSVNEDTLLTRFIVTSM